MRLWQIILTVAPFAGVFMILTGCVIYGMTRRGSPISDQWARFIIGGKK
jgi:hypothetical protein